MSWTYELENIHNVGRAITLQELKDIELEILKAFHSFCEENGLTYYLAGGTLLGAVRHQGFIPWDDDIDVLMPRPDYYRFLELTDTRLGEYEVRSIQTHPEIHTRPFIRIHNTKYMTKLTTPPFYMPPWIDIFPLDGLPEDVKASTEHFKKAHTLKRIVGLSWLPVSYRTKRKSRQLLKKVVGLPVRMIGHNYWLKKLEAFGLSYKFEDCEYVACVVAGGHGKRERVKKSEFCDPILMKFEDAYFWGPKGYHKYLSQLYGKKYMCIPAKKMQTHLATVWEIQEGGLPEETENAEPLADVGDVNDVSDTDTDTEDAVYTQNDGDVSDE